MQIAGMIFQTRSSNNIFLIYIKIL
ncbi:hypothetical protein ACTNES_17215 [Blautia sp. HCP3S3_D9]